MKEVIMHTPSPTADHTPPRHGRPDQRDTTWHHNTTWHHKMLHAAPAVVTALYGAWWIAAQAGSGRGSIHTIWQSLALAEAVLVLLLRRRKPIGALASILAVYLLTDLPTLTLLPVLFALFTVARIRDHRMAAAATSAAAAVIAAMPYIHGDPVSFAGHILPHLAAAGVAAAAGACLRRWKSPHTTPPSQARAVSLRPTGPAADQELEVRGAGTEVHQEKNPSDRGRTDSVTEFQQLALDPSVPLRGILCREPLDERGDLGADRRPARPVRVGPLLSGQAAVPPQHGAGRD